MRITTTPKAADLRVAIVPEHRSDPYFAQLRHELERRGVCVADDIVLRPSASVRIARSLDAVHLQWPEYLVRQAHNGSSSGFLAWARTVLTTARVISTLVIIRCLGVRLVWTVHNLRPHVRLFPGCCWVTYRCFALIASAIVYHSEHAAVVGSARFGRRRVSYVVPHGNYIGYYRAPDVGRGTARRALGLSEEQTVVLAFGQIRADKGLLQLSAAIRQFREPDVRLLVVGAPADPQTVAALERAATADPRIVLKFGRVPDDSVAMIFSVADVAAVAYENMFTSGVLLLALSLGVPAVAPAGTSASELGGTPAIETYLPGQLAEAIVRACEGDRTAQRAAAHHIAKRFDWVSIAGHLCELYEGETALQTVAETRRRSGR